MKVEKAAPLERPKLHFIKRAGIYNRSSRWVSDSKLIDKIYRLSGVKDNSRVLDVAIGTGKIAKAYYKKAKFVVGLDICINMAKQAKPCANAVVLSNAERISFKDNTFNICVCRQGLQFMDLNKALPDIYRVLKPGGRIVLCHLTAYEHADKDATFLIQKLRNPARKNFFLPQDIPVLLKKTGFAGIFCREYITKESVNRWANNGAISKRQVGKIYDAYINSSRHFKRIHNVEFKNGDIFDSMKMVIVKGVKPGE